MVRHIVMFGIQGGDGLDATAQAKRLGDLLMTLPAKIDFIRNMEVGVNAKEADETNYELLLSCDFDTLEDVKKYAVHEEHVKVAKEIGKYKTKRACVDFEI